MGKTKRRRQGTGRGKKELQPKRKLQNRKGATNRWGGGGDKGNHLTANKMGEIGL